MTLVNLPRPYQPCLERTLFALLVGRQPGSFGRSTASRRGEKSKASKEQGVKPGLVGLFFTTGMHEKFCVRYNQYDIM